MFQATLKIGLVGRPTVLTEDEINLYGFDDASCPGIGKIIYWRGHRLRVIGDTRAVGIYRDITALIEWRGDEI